MIQEPVDTLTSAAQGLAAADTAQSALSATDGGTGFRLTPYHVLRMLPRDATPAQQDSAIQAWFQPGEIHYSQRPDTLHLPGHDAGRNLLDISLPQYYRESFFSADTLFHPEISGGRYGVAGDPVPYAIRNDDIITGTLLLCFILSIIAIANSFRFIRRQLKDLFYGSHSDKVTIVTETATELRFQFFLVLQTCLLLALTYHSYVTTAVADTFIVPTEYHLIGIFLAVILGVFLLRSLLYTFVNTVFFGRKKNLQFLKSLLFLTAAEGVMIFPVVLLQIYFDIPLQSVAYSLTILLILFKMLTFYKAWVIFFKQNIVFLQIILYFCALEIVPLLSLWGCLEIIVNELKINF